MTDNVPVFSIVTPVFNAVEKIDATVASVIEQAPGLWDYIIVDGGSTDGTVERLGTFGPGVRWISEPDAGIYDAMNKGLRLSTGRYVYFLGAGDLLRPGILQMVADSLPADADGRLFVYGDMIWPMAGGRYGGVFTASRLALQNIGHQAIFYGRGIFDLLGGFNLRYRNCADFEMNIRCFGQPKIRKVYLDLVVADYEGGGSSESGDQKFINEWALIAWRHLGLRVGLRVARYRTIPFCWRRLKFHLRNWRMVPGRVMRRLRRLENRS